MGFFGFFRQPDINQGVKDYQSTPGALLLDVRTPAEYREGHIHSSINLPLQKLDNIEYVTENKDRALFVYCRSGSRSKQAAGFLQDMGYTNVKNIGGIIAYTGNVEGNGYKAAVIPAAHACGTDQ